MSHPMMSLIDQIIQAAEKRGEFEDLPGAGKPLPEERNPADAVLNRLMTEHRAKPLVVTLKQDIAATRAHLAALTDPELRKAQMKVLADLELRLALEMEAIRRYG